MTILIVDDEPLARQRLVQLLSEIQPGITLTEASDGIEALHQIETSKPDIVLLDIRMPRMDGLEVAKHVLKLDRQPAIIFTTAYQDHAINAFDANAVDYLLKPIRKERLQVALDRASVINRSRLDSLSESVEEKQQRTHVSAVVNGTLELIPVSQIYYLKAEQKYVTAAWPEGEILLDDTLVTLEEEFSNTFIRIHRNALVAKEHIVGLGKNDEGQHFVRLAGIKDELLVSRRHLSDVKALLNKLANR